MDSEADLLVPPHLAPNFCPTITSDTTSSLSSSFTSSSSAPDLVRHVQAAFKRRRPLGSVQSKAMMPKRSLAPKREALRCLDSNVVVSVDTIKSQHVASSSRCNLEKDPILWKKNRAAAAVGEIQEDAYITPPPISDTITNNFDENFNPFDAQRDRSKPDDDRKEHNPLTSSHSESQHDQIQRKVRFSVVNRTIYQGADDRMATGKENLSSHMGSLALTEMEWDANNQAEASTVINDDSKLQHFRNAESDIRLGPDGGISSSLTKRTPVVHDQLHQFRNFLSQPATQFSVVGSSFATSTSIHSTSAPMHNSTTCCSHSHQEGSTLVTVEPVGDFNMNLKPINRRDMIQPSCSSIHNTKIQVDEPVIAGQASTSVIKPKAEAKEHEFSKEKQDSVMKEGGIPNDPSLHNDKSMEERQFGGNSTEIQSQDPLSKNSSSDMKLEASKLEKQEKNASSKGVSMHRKRNYDPELFFKVNGKLYQRLGKIGSGGSSEVHKVISSDCKIYALKKIKLKGRDYATAFGFCQEIEYLNKLKGKNNIIQLIDYEVTDKALLRENLNGYMTNKDARVRDDGYIYMVLEYGEIDLAHMLSQILKEMDGTNQTMDENWLRFYWQASEFSDFLLMDFNFILGDRGLISFCPNIVQQMLKAVNTIHEERIVHSDLKPANFLLVKGSLKLIDFGIAKAIMSDTTNIQRDSQVGTLSYMSPEAFMCNDSDAKGNTIKCGRPSDIWSLGCILYQMVYGRTPFCEYKTFWAKFKVITDPNHEITYEPVPNPWVVDLMKKCLAWDRNERWRILQLLQHPFLAPPVSIKPSSPPDQSYELLQLLADACADDHKASGIYGQLSQLIRDPIMPATTQLSASRDQQCKLLSDMSRLCFELQKCLANQEENR